MACRPGQLGRLQNLRRPARIVCAALGLAVLVGSLLLPNSPLGSVAAALGGLVLVVAVLLPGLTDFQIDVLGIKLGATLATRAQTVETICQRESGSVASVVALVGFDRDQAGDVVKEAAEDTARLWRGPVVDDLVGRFLICRAARIVTFSLRRGGPYRLPTPPETDEPNAAWATFTALEPRQRLIVALVEYADIPPGEVATMLDVELHRVEEALTVQVGAGQVPGGSP